MSFPSFFYSSLLSLWSFILRSHALLGIYSNCLRPSSLWNDQLHLLSTQPFFNNVLNFEFESIHSSYTDVSNGLLISKVASDCLVSKLENTICGFQEEKVEGWDNCIVYLSVVQNVLNTAIYGSPLIWMEHIRSTRPGNWVGGPKSWKRGTFGQCQGPIGCDLIWVSFQWGAH